MNQMIQNGYLVKEVLCKNDLIELRTRINNQIKRVLQSTCHQAALTIADCKDPLSIYHTIENDNDHANIWAKENRLLNDTDTRWFESCKSMTKLREEFKFARISDEEQIGRSNYYWRLTRPREANDVGPIHRDEWFWLLNNNFNEDLKGLKRVKVWISVQTVPGLNGLLVEPESHRRIDLKWEGKKTSTIIKPVLLSDIDPGSMKLIHTPPGTGIVFDDRLLHGGSVNNANTCRCSIEFTMLIPSQASQK